jgi:phospho-2-dehydro-3-deoxyheptonate aldolase
MAQGRAGHEQIQATEARLTQHWMLDEVAAAELAQGISLAGHQYIDELADGVELAPAAVSARDEHRAEIGAILRGDSERQLVVIGPCSLDTETDYASLFDYVGELQEEHEDAVIALRANGSKPRTSGGWGGLVRSTDPTEQELVVEINQEAFRQHIPILTEITDRDEFGVLAPYLSAAWIGARDVESTA